MGFSLRDLTDNIRDIFDSNTESDRRKRLARGEPEWYADQQRQLRSQGSPSGYTSPFRRDSSGAYIPPPQAPPEDDFNMVDAIFGSLADTLTKPSVWNDSPVNVGDFTGSGVIEDFINSPFKVGKGAAKVVGEGKFKEGGGDIVTGLLEGPLGFVPVTRAGKAGLAGGSLLSKVGQGAKIGAKEGSVFGGAYGAGEAMSENKDFGDIVKGGITGTLAGGAGGALFGGSIPLATAGAKATGRGLSNLADNQVPLNEAGFAKVPKGKAKVTMKRVGSGADSEVIPVKQTKSKSGATKYSVKMKLGSEAVDVPVTKGGRLTKDGKNVMDKVLDKQKKSIEGTIYKDSGKVTVKRNKAVKFIYGDKGRGPGAYKRAVITLRDNKLPKLVTDLTTSKSFAARKLGQSIRGFSKELAQTSDERVPLQNFQGKVNTANEFAADVNRHITGLVKNNPARLEKAWKHLDPKLAGGKKVAYKSLTKQEQKVVDAVKLTSDYLHNLNYRNGFISKKTWQKYRGGKYLARGYDPYEFLPPEAAKQFKQTRKAQLEIYKKRGELDTWNKANAVKNPGFLTSKRLYQTLANDAFVRLGDGIAKETRMVSKTAKPGFVKLSNAKGYGKLAGKHVRQDVYDELMGFQSVNSIVDSVYTLMNWYERNPVRRGIKKALTVYNPAVRVGNRFGNGVFSHMMGINPVTFAKHYATANQKHIRARSPLYRKMREEGIVGTDALSPDIGTHSKGIRSTVKGKSKTDQTKELASRIDEVVAGSYGQADDAAKVAAMEVLLKRGYSWKEAARQVTGGFQNYRAIGNLFEAGAKVPVFGQAFGRFSGTLLNIVKNNLVEHPVRNISTVMLWAAFTDMMSKASGETPEEKKIREERPGVRRVPIVGTSLEVQTPWGAFDVGRLFGVWAVNDRTGSSIQSTINQFSPFQTPTNAREAKIAAGADPLIGPVISALSTDVDFKGDSISDPEGVTYDESGKAVDKFPTDPLSTGEKLGNKAKFLGRQYTPAFLRDVENFRRSTQGQESLYGSKLTPVQAAARFAGLRASDQGKEQAKKSKDIKEHIEETEYIEGLAKKLSPEGLEAYKRWTGFAKLRDKVPNEFQPGEERYKKAPVYEFSENKWGDLKSDKKLYSVLQTSEYRNHERNVRNGVHQPIRPEFDKSLSKEFRTQLINNKSQAPGEDVEADQRMYSMSEWDKYENLKDKYKEQSKKYYPNSDDEFVDELVKHQNAEFPEKPKAYESYSEAYAKYAEGKGAKPQFTDAVGKAKDKYEEAKLKWTNAERKARGLPPISKEVWANASFGFQSDEEKIFNELKYGKGFGGFGGFGGGGGSDYDPTANPYKYAIDPSAGGSIARVTVKTPSKGRIKTKGKGSVKKPKVTLKKSKV